VLHKSTETILVAAFGVETLVASMSLPKMRRKRFAGTGRRHLKREKLEKTKTMKNENRNKGAKIKNSIGDESN
jgi:hypothetical protein